MLRRFPKDLPLFGALLLGLSLMAFGYTAMYVDLAIGRPSSTAGLALLFIPIWGVVAAIVGFVLGLIARTIWRRAKNPAGPERPTWALVIALGIAIVASAGAGALDVIHYEREAKPHVRHDSGQLVREFRADSERSLRTSTALYDSADDKQRDLSWGNNKSELLFANDRVVLRDTATGKTASFRTPALDYITRVDAAPLSAMPAHPMLALAISGRATGRRAVVAVIDANYKVIFEEQLERFWELRDTPIEIRIRPTSNEEFIVVGPRCDRSLVLRRKGAA